MRKILICLMLMFSTLIFAQVDCYKLKVKGENYVLSDSNPKTWCEIAEAVNTSFTKCMCEEEKKRKEEEKARDKKIADSQALAKRNSEKENQIRELTVKARELGQNKEYDKALSLLNQAKSIAESYEEVPKVDLPGYTHYSKSDKIGWVQNSIDDMQRAKDNSGGELSLVLSSPSSIVDEKEVASKKEGTKTSSQVSSESINQKKQREAEEESAEDIERARIVKAKSDELAKRAREAERKRRAEEAEKARIQRKNNYDLRVKRANDRNIALAGAAGTANVSTFVMIGKMVYRDMGQIRNTKIYSGENSMYFGFDIGYSISSIPIYFNSTRESYNGNNTTYVNELQNSGALTLNLSPTLKLGYEANIKDSYGVYGYGFVGGDLGLSPFMIAFNSSYKFGGRLGAGFNKVKFFWEYNNGVKNFSINNWIDSEESGSGSTKTKYANNIYGLQFSWYSSMNSPGRKHFLIGIIKERFLENDDLGIQLVNGDYSSHIIASSFASKEKYTGYMIEYKKDHYSKLNLKMFFNYPYTGKVDPAGLSDDLNGKNKGGWFVRIGYTKSIDSFF